MDVNIVYFLNDLRVTDHVPLYEASKASLPIVGVYIYDPFYYKETKYGFKKTGKYRAKFIIESVKDLKQRLASFNIPLLTFYGPSERIMKDLSKKLNIKNVYYHQEYGSEEVAIMKLIKLNLTESKFNAFDGKSLYHPLDLPFSIQTLPEVFTDFRKQTEFKAKPRAMKTITNKQDPIELNIIGDDVSLKTLGLEESELILAAGETGGMARIKYYMFDSKKALYYKNTRNGMYNFDDSTKFSPYLALGCVSPRYIYSELKRFEASYGSNESTYWIYFELMWRDYFHFIHMKHGNKLFMAGGIYHKKTNYISNQSYRDAWCNGLTGFQLVDANMIELNQTGWMSNRGRQNVASFIIKYVNQDWRFGATYFESMLLDYDVSSNYGNWLYNASLGNDPRDNRMFNVNKQGYDYDPSGKYLTKWLPQFKKLPKEFYYKTIELNELQELTFDFKLGKDYPHPIIKPFFKD